MGHWRPDQKKRKKKKENVDRLLIVITYLKIGLERTVLYLYGTIKGQSVIPLVRDAVSLGRIQQFPPVREWYTNRLQSLKYCISRILHLLHFHLQCPTGRVDSLTPYQQISPGALSHLIRLGKYGIPITRQ